MLDEKLIQKWVKEGTINNRQAKKMLEDTSNYKKESRSNKLIIAVSTIGAILLGIGAILLIASNWKIIPDIIKVLILLISTFGSYSIGYIFKYQKQNLPKVGASLLFLGAMLFGATIILITQIYHINANNHFLVLIWLIGILPLVYVLKNEPIATLASVLFFLWLGLFFSMNNEWWFFEILGPITFVLFIIGSVMLFSIGGLHYFKKDLSSIARVYRIASLKILMICLFLLTFSVFSKASSYYLRRFSEIPKQLTIGIIILAIIAIIVLIINWFFNKSEKISKFEGPIGIGMIALALIFSNYPSTTSIYVLIFNFVVSFMIGLLFYLGYEKEDISLVNMGTFWLSALIIVRYFDWFWDLMSRSLFFLVGGLILVLGGIALEKKRREIKKDFENE